MEIRRSLRVDELASRWQVSRRTIERMIRAGLLPSFKLAQARRILVTDIEVYEKTSTCDSTRQHATSRP